MEDKDFLSYFDKLGQFAKDKDATIIENTEKILTTLLTVEHQAPTKTDEYNSELGHLVSEDLEYAVSRLLRGTTSDAFSSKLAFGTPLVGVLKTFKHIQPEKYIAYTDKTTDRNDAFTKGERSHYMSSRLLSIYALIVSGRIDQLPNSMDVYSTLYSSFAQNIKEMPWCGQQVLYAIETSIEKAHDAKVALKRVNVAIKTFKGPLKSAASNVQPDFFGLLAYLARKQIELEAADKQSALHDVMRNITGDSKLIVKLFEGAMEIYPEKHISLRYLAEYVNKVMNPKEQEAFWAKISVIVKDDTLTGKDKKPRHQLYFTALALFKYWVKSPLLSNKVFLEVMKSEVFQIWMKQLKVLNKPLRNEAKRIEKHLSSKIVNILKETGKMTTLEFLLMIKENRGYMFDLKNPMAKALLETLSEEESVLYLNKLIEGFQQEKESYQFYMSELLVLFEMNYKQISDKNVLKICQFFLDTYLNFEFSGESVGNESEGITPEDAIKAITQGVKEEAFIKLNSIISRLIKKPLEAFKTRKNPLWLGISKTGELWTYRVLKLLLKAGKVQELPYIETVKKVLKCLGDLQTEIQEHLMGDQEDIEEKTQEKVKKLLALILLISSSALQLLNHPEVEESLDELVECSKRIKENLQAKEVGGLVSKKRNTGKKDSKKLVKEDEEDGSKPVDVLVDIMISMLTRCPGYLREAIERTFGQFVDDVGNFSLENLIAVVIRKDDEYFEDMKDDEQRELAEKLGITPEADGDSDEDEEAMDEETE